MYPCQSEVGPCAICLERASKRITHLILGADPNKRTETIIEEKTGLYGEQGVDGYKLSP